MKATTWFAFEDLRAKWTWPPISECPGRFVLVADDPRLAVEELAGGDLEVERYRAAGVRDEVLVARIAGGWVILYRRSDGTYVHTLNTYEGFARKLAQLGIDLSA